MTVSVISKLGFCNISIKGDKALIAPAFPKEIMADFFASMLGSLSASIKKGIESFISPAPTVLIIFFLTFQSFSCLYCVLRNGIPSF